MKTASLWMAMTVLPALAVGVVQQKPAPLAAPVAYVSSQRISNETTDGKAGVARLQAAQRERAAEVRTKQQALDAARKQMAQAPDPVERARLQAQEQTLRGDLERAASQSQADLLTLQRQVSAEVATKVKAAVVEVVRGTGVQLVLNGESSVVWAADGMDLTSQVIEKMNAQAAAPPAPGQEP